MKKTTWLTLAMFIVSPIILIALAQVCIKNKSNVVNLTQSKLLRLQPVEAVVLHADSALARQRRNRPTTHNYDARHGRRQLHLLLPRDLPSHAKRWVADPQLVG